MPKHMDVLPNFQRATIEFAPIPQFVYEGDLQSELAAGLPADEAVCMYDHLLHILRQFQKTHDIGAVFS